jgi:membrane protease YdiL (CAAX protease family)
MKLLERRRRFVPEVPSTDEAPDWGAGWTLAIPILLIVLQVLAVGVIRLAVPPTLATVLVGALVADALTIAIAWHVLCRKPGRSVRRLGLGPPRRWSDLLLRPIVGGILAVAALTLAGVLYAFFSGGRPPPPQRAVEILAGIQEPGLKLLAVAAVVVAAPVAEEIAFRGVLYRGLEWRRGRAAAYVGSALLFSIAHLDFQHALPLFALGLVLAWTVDRSRSIYPGMILHGTINLSSLLLVW